MRLVGHIVQRDPAIGLHRLIHIFARAHRANDQRHLVRHAQRQIFLQAGIAFVDD